jgi:hypothetical protein
MTTSMTASARTAARSQHAVWLARAGLAAWAFVYFLIGVLAIALAFGHYKNEPDQQGRCRPSRSTLEAWRWCG